MARLRQSSVGRIPAKTNKSSIGVECRRTVTLRKASLIGLLMKRVWKLSARLHSAIELLPVTLVATASAGYL